MAEVLYVKFEVSGSNGNYFLSVDGEKQRQFRSFFGAMIHLQKIVTQYLKDAVNDDGERVWGADANPND